MFIYTEYYDAKYNQSNISQILNFKCSKLCHEASDIIFDCFTCLIKFHRYHTHFSKNICIVSFIFKQDIRY